MSPFDQAVIVIAPTLGAGLFSLFLRSSLKVLRTSFRDRGVGAVFGLMAAMSVLVALGMTALFSFGAVVTGYGLAIIGIPIGLYAGYVSEPAISRNLKFGHPE